MELRWCAHDDPDFTVLVSQLDAYLRDVQGENHAKFAPHNAANLLSDTAVLMDGSVPVACGAIKLHEGGSTAEIKRMYVLPAYRGQGLAKRMLSALENRARELGCTQLLLETNASFTSAIALYRGFGFATIPNFGVYACLDSYCMGKAIPSETGDATGERQ